MTISCGKNIYLRELSPGDEDRILEIVYACAANSTRLLYRAYKNSMYNQSFRISMNDILEKDFLPKMFKNFKNFDNIMARKNITKKEQYEAYLDEIYEALKFFPDDHLFFPYGPIQPPFEKKVKEFLDSAIKTKDDNDRRIYRMGIMKYDVLIGCFTIDFDEHIVEDYPDITTGDPGIFIDPACRIDNGISSWKVAFLLATTIVEKFCPSKVKENKISVTTHRLNEETGNILSESNGFKEHGPVNTEYGARRFFTITQQEFVTNFRKGETNYQAVIT